ncbi:ATP-binding protein [Photobacterium angustum]|uniref:ATP-binding protein n=1 Tax=Photobacterium angustum TaxID=661 RepID=UPI002010E31A|nr:DUF3404 domain-containing protein [Photobacterium angustum]
MSLFSSSTHEPSTLESWLDFYNGLWNESDLVITQNSIAQYPNQLLITNAQYPDFEHFSWHDLEQLSQVIQECKAPDVYNPLLGSAIEFELYRCKNIPIPYSWFLAHEKIHPAGGTFADRYFENVKTYDNKVNTLFSGDNPSHPLNDIFKKISKKGRDALLSGYRAWLEPDALWLNGGSGWKRIPNNKWQPFAKKLEISINANQCNFRYSNLCIANNKPENNIIVLFSTILSFFLIILLGRTLYLKRKQSRDKRFILQLLTHELRTPIASLGMTVGLFRQEFDSLNDNSQNALWRLIEDYERLSQLTDASKSYLSSKYNQKYTYQKANIKDWLEYNCEQHNINFNLDEEKTLKLPYYWLTICLNNLIINAKQHGKSPIIIEVTTQDRLMVIVKDSGNFPYFWQRKSSNQVLNKNNMGIGLSLVSHLMEHIGGKVILKRHPTRLILELPL